MKKPKTIEQFVSEQRTKETLCWACRLPPEKRRMIEEARKKGFSIKRINEWASSELGLTESSFARIENHLLNHLTPRTK